MWLCTAVLGTVNGSEVGVAHGDAIGFQTPRARTAIDPLHCEDPGIGKTASDKHAVVCLISSFDVVPLSLEFAVGDSPSPAERVSVIALSYGYRLAFLAQHYDRMARSDAHVVADPDAG